MFALNGYPSPTSLAAGAIIHHCGFDVQAEHPDSVAITVYRCDPLDDYFYLTAFAGLKEKEPMFGPLRSTTDYRRNPTHATLQDKHGFRKREGVVWCHDKREKTWHLYVSGREGVTLADAEERIRALENSLQGILTPSPAPSSLGPFEPLFPELWYRERLIRDQLREITHNCAPGTPFENKATRITTHLEQAFAQLLSGGTAWVGIYLNTGAEWRLCGRQQEPPWICAGVEKRRESSAFAWVSDSTRAVLIDCNMSDIWRNRLLACGPTFDSLLKEPTFQGLCLVPILYGPQRSESFGIIELVSRTKPLSPAHLFLLSRISLGVSGYLIPLMPFQGFPWWPDAKLLRGEANVQIANPHPAQSVDLPEEIVELGRLAATDLMPKDARVTLRPLRWGHSGAVVFRLDVLDEGGLAEVPRVLKLGSDALISQELKAYATYVHNKLPGTDSRIDIARSSVWTVSSDTTTKFFGGRPPAAIVYTLVGAGDHAQPWSEWCRNDTLGQLERGLELLWDRLQSWYSRTRQERASKNAIELMIEPIAEGRLQDYLQGLKTVPAVQEVRHLIDSVYHARVSTKVCNTCIVHGDLHADNLFAVLDKKNRIKSVALIDWASVRSEWHPLSDISKLMVDLAYRVVPSSELREFCRKVVQQWGRDLPCGRNDWAVALVHQIAKIMFYRAESSGKPYISDEARMAAWEDLQDLVKLILTKAASAR